MGLSDKYCDFHERVSYPDVLSATEVIHLLVPGKDSTQYGRWLRILYDELVAGGLVPDNGNFVRFTTPAGCLLGVRDDTTGEVVKFHRDQIRGDGGEKEGGVGGVPSDCCISRWWGDIKKNVTPSVSSKSDPLSVFHLMEDLRADEVSISFCADGLIEIAARTETGGLAMMYSIFEIDVRVVLIHKVQFYWG